MAVIGFSNPHRQPKMEAKSPTIIVMKIIIMRAQMKVNQPPQKCTGGTIANII